MSTTKIYAIHGRTTVVMRVPTGSGKAYYSAEFANGLPDAGPNYRPATFSTSDPLVQKIMESSPFFGKMYVLHRIYREKSGKPAANTAAAAQIKPTVALEKLDGIMTKEEAIAYLKSKGAKATDLRSYAAINAYAESIGVSFPNLQPKA